LKRLRIEFRHFGHSRADCRQNDSLPKGEALPFEIVGERCAWSVQ
jgi:hypothetical protein